MVAAAKKKPAAKKAPAKKVAVKRPAATKTPQRRAVLEAAGAAPAPGRRALLDEIEAPLSTASSDYFAKVDKAGINFISAGATLIDCCVGGGWAEGRMVNIVGDKSAGKTLLAIEACANFAKKYTALGKQFRIRYGEVEAAFDRDYAEALGLPEDCVEFYEPDAVNTVEDFQKDLETTLGEMREDEHLLYIIDSYDALSDDAEAARDIDEKSFGATKAKKSSELFRRVTRQVEAKNCLLVVISQLRDKIGVTFGEKQTRSGGRALDFYASQIVWLADIGKIRQERQGVTRVIGVNVKMRVKKNKVGLPFRECEYPVLFGYGVDDITAGVAWLVEVKKAERLAELEMSVGGYAVRISNLRNKGGEGISEVRRKLDLIVREEWADIERRFLPQSKKY